ncbi:hypothetical protein ACFVQ0_36365 [Streptomyces sp. NPDC057900]|uniref:hypothetical protein n=1 Tax=Streptomyces sp. NPDC057900 TaxID=3346274 RepID=UPI0036EA82FF
MPDTLDVSLPTHPRTGESALGFRRDGRPIWPIKGGSGEGGDPSAPPAPTGEPGANPPSTDPGAPPAADPAAEQQLAAVQQQATEATEQRDQLQAALDAVNKALNPDGADAEQDPAKLAAAVADRDKQLGDLSAELRTARVELAAYRAAGEQGARADRLLNSRSFLSAISELDPADETFAATLGAAITTAVEGDPDLYRAAPTGPARGGAEFNGAPTGDRRPASLRDAIAARFGA